MSDHLAWAQWWASPWLSSHPDASSAQAFHAMHAVCRSQPGLACAALGIEPCLPPAPLDTVLGLALASREQIDLAMALLDLTCHPYLDSPLCDEHRKWCERLPRRCTLTPCCSRTMIRCNCCGPGSSRLSGSVFDCAWPLIGCWRWKKRTRYSTTRMGGSIRFGRPLSGVLPQRAANSLIVNHNQPEHCPC